MLRSEVPAAQAERAETGTHRGIEARVTLSLPPQGVVVALGYA
jgi:hypothetical protein